VPPDYVAAGRRSLFARRSASGVLGGVAVREAGSRDAALVTRGPGGKLGRIQIGPNASDMYHIHLGPVCIPGLKNSPSCENRLNMS
jgi:hypothetical protein